MRLHEVVSRIRDIATAIEDDPGWSLQAAQLLRRTAERIVEENAEQLADESR